jgi:hypothetical protein
MARAKSGRGSAWTVMMLSLHVVFAKRKRKKATKPTISENAVHLVGTTTESSLCALMVENVGPCSVHVASGLGGAVPLCDAGDVAGTRAMVWYA